MTQQTNYLENSIALQITMIDDDDDEINHIIRNLKHTTYTSLNEIYIDSNNIFSIAKFPPFLRLNL